MKFQILIASYGANINIYKNNMKNIKSIVRKRQNKDSVMDNIKALQQDWDTISQDWNAIVQDCPFQPQFKKRRKL